MNPKLCTVGVASYEIDYGSVILCNKESCKLSLFHQATVIIYRYNKVHALYDGPLPIVLFISNTNCTALNKAEPPHKDIGEITSGRHCCPWALLSLNFIQKGTRLQTPS